MQKVGSLLITIEKRSVEKYAKQIKIFPNKSSEETLVLFSLNLPFDELNSVSPNSCISNCKQFLTTAVAMLLTLESHDTNLLRQFPW